MSTSWLKCPNEPPCPRCGERPPPITHLVPPAGEGGGLMSCCGRTLFEVPGTDRITLDANLVTCGTAHAVELEEDR